MTTAQGGMGLAIQMDVGGTLAALAQVLEVDFPVFKAFLAEATGHDSPSGYYEAGHTGKRRLMPIRAVMAWDQGLTSHAGVITAFNADVPLTFSLADPDGDETIAFEAFIEELARMAAQEDILKAEILIHPTGVATIT